MFTDWINFQLNPCSIYWPFWLQALLVVHVKVHQCISPKAVYLSVCVPHMWVNVLICPICLSLCLPVCPSFCLRKIHRTGHFSLIQIKTLEIWVFEVWYFWTEAADSWHFVLTHNLFKLKNSCWWQIKILSISLGSFMRW